MAADNLDPPALAASLSAAPRRRWAALASEPWSRMLCGRLVLVLVGLGIICRLAQYLAGISYWHDEAALVLNILDKSARELLGPLDYVQTAPPLFLLAAKSCANSMGVSEYTLRLVPQMSAILALALFALLAWRVLKPQAAVFATALFALSPQFIAHAAEVKQYSSDVLIATVLLALAAGSERPRSPTARLALLSLVSAAAMWLSEPALFVFGGISLAFLPQIVRRSITGAIKYIACNLPAVISFALLYWLSMRVQQVSGLYDFWAERGTFADFSRPYLLPIWLGKQVVNLCDYPYEPLGLLILALAVSGIRALWRTSAKLLLAICLAPIALTLLAGILHQYPFGGSRVTLFLAPGIFLLAAAGAAHLAQYANLNLRRWWWIAPAVLALSGAGQAAYHLIIPRNRSHIRPAVEYVRSHRLPGETLYVIGGNSLSSFLCYWRHPEPPVIDSNDLPTGPLPARFWVVFEFDPDQGLKKREPSLQRARAAANQDAPFIANGGAAFHFHRNDPPATAASSPSP